MALEEAGHPVARFHLSDRYGLGAEMFRWRWRPPRRAPCWAQPLRQPDVQLAKERQQGMKGGVQPLRREVGTEDSTALTPRWPTGCARPAWGLPRPVTPTSPRRPARPRCYTPSKPCCTRRRASPSRSVRPPASSTPRPAPQGVRTAAASSIRGRDVEDLPCPNPIHLATLIRAQADGDRQALGDKDGLCCGFAWEGGGPGAVPAAQDLGAAF